MSIPGEILKVPMPGPGAKKLANARGFPGGDGQC